jgi:DNA-binding response OmpR family regulator
MRVAVVEDDASVGRLVKRVLEREGYSVSLYSTAEALIDEVFNYGKEFELLVVDLMLPGASGIELTAFLRERGVEWPILILTALSEEEDKVRGLDAGADDYITKPFGVKEFAARVRALLRRRKRRELQLTPKGVIVDGKEVKLTGKERALLELLIKNRGKAVSKEEIFLKVWKGEGSRRVVDVYVKYLRDKIGNRIETVWGVGYRLT